MPAQTGGKKVQVAKRPNPASRPRGAAAAAAPADVSSGVRVKATIEELRKVVWPSFDELTRMTGIVIATVLIFAAIIGGFDYILAYGVGKIYNTPTTTAAPTPTAVRATNDFLATISVAPSSSPPNQTVTL